MDRQFFEIDSDLFRLSPQPIWIYNWETLEVIDFNNAACNKFDLKLQEVQGHLITDFRSPSTVDRFKAKLKRIKERSPYERNNQAVVFNNRRVWIETEFHRLKISEDSKSELVVVERDISDERYERILNETKSEIIEELALSQDLSSILQRIVKMFSNGRDDLAVAVLDHDAVGKQFNVVAQDRLSSKYKQAFDRLDYKSIKEYLDLIRNDKLISVEEEEFTYVQFPISKSYPKYRIIPIQGNHFLFGAIILYGQANTSLSHISTKLIREAKNLLRITLKKAFHRKQIKEHESRFEATIKNIPIYVSRMDLDGRHHWFANHHFDIDSDRFVGKTMPEIFGPDSEYAKKFEEQRKKVIETGEKQSILLEFDPVQRSEILEENVSAGISIRSTLVPTINDSGEIEGFFHCGYDVTELVKQKQQITQTLNERNTLLAEIHHRVKNNLAVIDSLLGLQGMSIESEEAAQIIAFSQSRVQAMKHVHENLYNHELLTEVKIHEFLQHHVEQMKERNHHLDMGIEVNCDPISVNLIQAVPFALAINELLMLYCEKICPEFDTADIILNAQNGSDKIVTEVIIKGHTEMSEEIVDKHINLELLETVISMLEGEINFVVNGSLKAEISFSPK